MSDHPFDDIEATLKKSVAAFRAGHSSIAEARARFIANSSAAVVGDIRVTAKCGIARRFVLFSGAGETLVTAGSARPKAYSMSVVSSISILG